MRSASSISSTAKGSPVLASGNLDVLIRLDGPKPSIPFQTVAPCIPFSRAFDSKVSCRPR